MSVAKKMNSIGLRISSENKEIIRTAAQFNGQDLTSYLVSTALERARKDILEHKEMQALLFSERDYNTMSEELEKASRPNEKLKKAFKKHSKKFEE